MAGVTLHAGSNCTTKFRVFLGVTQIMRMLTLADILEFKNTYSALGPKALLRHARNLCDQMPQFWGNESRRVRSRAWFYIVEVTVDRS